MLRARAGSVAVFCAVALGAPGARAADELAPVDRASALVGTESRPSKPTQGAGSVELRLQTATNIAIGGQLAFAAAPGFAYNLDEEEVLVNVVGGAAYFLTPGFALGMDASYTRFPDESRLITVAPLAKLVSNFERWRLGAFVELSPGLLFADFDAERATYLQLSAWGGVHIPITDSAALVVGPTVTALIGVNETGESDVLLGDRIGLNVYLPSNMPPRRARPTLGRRTFELRFQTGTHAATGGVLSPQSSQSLLYSTRDNVIWANAVGGGGIFLTDALALGGELSHTYIYDVDTTGSAQLVGTAGFAKLVSGMVSWAPGAFIEVSPGMFALLQPNRTQRRARISAVSQLSLWAGAHLPVGTSTAFAIGPSITRFDDLGRFGEGLFLVGARFGVSLYMPTKRRGP